MGEPSQVVPEPYCRPADSSDGDSSENAPGILGRDCEDSMAVRHREGLFCIDRQKVLLGK